MARYKETEKDQGQFVTVNFYEQLIAGSYNNKGFGVTMELEYIFFLKLMKADTLGIG